MRKRILSLLILFAVFCPVIMAESSGTCGKNLTWTLTDDGVLTISGTGEMDTKYPLPWQDYLKTIKSVIIKEGVTSIGEIAFNYCSNLSSIDLPESTEKIGSGAFNNCSSLKSVKLGSNVTTIENTAFAHCDSLVSIDFGNNLQSIGYNCFWGCKALKEIVLPETLQKIGTNSFRYCYSLSNVVLPSSLKEIDDGVFCQCSSLSSITLPEGLERIGKQAFAYCFTELYYHGATLSTVVLPKSIRIIDNAAFNGCSMSLMPDFSECAALDSIGDYAFYDITRNDQVQTTLKLPGNVKYISPTAFSGNQFMERVYIDNNENYYVKDGILYSKDNVLIVCPGALQETSISVPEGIESIASNAFFYTGAASINHSNLSRLQLPNTLTSIGTYAFTQGSVKTMNIPFGVKHLQPGTFAANAYISNLFIDNPEPPTGKYKVFSGTGVYSRCIINVPRGCRKVYEESPFWGKFACIEEVDVSPVGDVNEDAKINVADLSYVGNMILTNDISKKKLADANLDGVINVEDIKKINNYILTGTFSSKTHKYVDLGLPSGTLWAETNIGAQRDYDYGSYFAWGETEEKDDYSASTYKWKVDGYTTAGTEYMPYILDDSGFWKTYCLTKENDAATANWGAEWETPSENQFQELQDNCTIEFTYKGGVTGVNIKGTNGNQIFVPIRNRSFFVSFSGTDPDYCSDTYDFNCMTRSAYILSKNYQWGPNIIDRTCNFSSWEVYNGYTVRPVRASASNSKARSSKTIIPEEPITISAGEEKTFTLPISTNKDIVCYQCDMVLPDGLVVKSVKIQGKATSRALMYKPQSDGSIRILSYTRDNSALNQDGNAIDVTIFADNTLASESRILLENVVMVTEDDDCIKTNDEICISSSNATGINSAIFDDSNPRDVYNLSGAIVKKSAKHFDIRNLRPGTYIIDGKKTVIK